MADTFKVFLGSKIHRSVRQVRKVLTGNSGGLDGHHVAQISSSLSNSGLHYFIIDEVDNLSKAAQQSLKSAMNTPGAIFILTTNHISELDKGFMDLCVRLPAKSCLPFYASVKRSRRKQQMMM